MIWLLSLRDKDLLGVKVYNSQGLSGTILCNIVKTNAWGVKISASIPSKNSIQYRQSIIAQAAARGLQLSEDGKSWVPVNSASSNLPLNQSNVIIVKKEQFDNSQVMGIIILYLFGTLVLLGAIYIVAIVAINILLFFFWCLTALGGGASEPFTPTFLFWNFSIFG